MRLIGRDDTSLAIALIVGTVLIFQQPLQFLFDVAGDIQRQYHVDLVQALVVLSVVFAFHQYRRRQEARGDALAAAAEAVQAGIRSEELERLVGLGRALANVADFTALSQVLVRYLSKFTQDRASWVLICRQGCWDVLLRDTDDRRSSEQLEAVAARALASPAASANLQIDDLLVFPFLVGDQPVGLLLVRNVPLLSLEERHGLEAASALTAIAIRNVHTLIATRDLSLRDALTGCFNRAHALDSATAELRRVRRHGGPLSVLMFDVDSFKRVNDSHGHLAGDQVLAEIGARLSEVVRLTDIKCRYGGDEFLIILPDTPANGARQVAESLRQSMSSIVIPVGADDRLSVTVSIGLATAQPEDRDAISVIARADRALYSAKRHGRNCVCADESEATSPLRLVGKERELSVATG